MAMLPALRRDAPLAVRAPAAPRARPAGEPHPGAHDAASAGDTVSPSAPEDQDLLKQQAAFDKMMTVLSEQQREANVIRDFMMEQLKRDAEIVKKWIEMI
jgi:hypothetical protein